LLTAAAERQRVGRFDEAIQILQRAVALAPSEPAAWVALADGFCLARRPEAALGVCDRALEAVRPQSDVLCAKARALQDLSRVSEAQALYEQAVALDADNASARTGLALAALERGEWAAAESLAAPLSGPAIEWIRARAALGRRDLERARALTAGMLARTRLSPDQTAETALLLGEALDGLGRAAEAFQAFTRGKQALRALYAERAAGRESEVARLERLAAWFRSADPAPWQAAPAATTAPRASGHAFLVGFPRSGTTLLEQALAGHSDLVSVEEAPTLAAASATLMTDGDALDRLATLSPTEAETWRARYWAEVDRAGVDPRGKVLLDKAPAATALLPLVAKLFPDARVFFPVRDPRDVVLSCFRNSFQMNALTYAFTDLGETARCYAATMTLAELYRSILPLSVTDVRFESLVGDFPAVLACVAGALGLDVQPRMLDVAATAGDRSIRTPSAQQVRAGLNRDGVGRWRAYSAELAAVTPLLEMWIDRFGYDGGAAG
jgi:tetratricopeptide (TPR) repeat protein